MKIALFDLETDGLLAQVTRVHVMAVRCLSTGKLRVFREHQMAEGLSYLDQFDLLVGHNIIKFDIPVLTKLFGYSRPWQRLRDTLVLSRLVWADIIQADLLAVKQKQFFPGKYMGSHSLAAWGHRMGNNKAEYGGGWAEWSQAMEDYCVQDLSVTHSLWERIKAADWAEESVLLETQTAYILARQERYGFLFDQQGAAALYGTLVQRRMSIEKDLQKVFRPMFLKDGPVFLPKADNKRFGYTEGAKFQKLKLTEFNPGSRDHVAHWLKIMRGWKPTEFTNDGSPKIDDEIMGRLPYPEAGILKEYFMVAKRIGQLAEGKEAWLKHVAADGRIHGSVNTGGTVTGRMSHSTPNMGQVPAAYSPYGPECRALFIVPKGKALIGCDADALELRDLAGYMAYYDNGTYIEAVLNGDKKKGTDTHSMNARALGLDPTKVYFDGETGRDIAKTWFLWKTKGTPQSNLEKNNCVNSGNSQAGQS